MRAFFVVLCLMSIGSVAHASLTIDLTKGSTHSSVFELQNYLITQQLLSAPATGYFGTATAQAVMRFQKREGLPVTGTVGPLTRLRMQASMDKLSKRGQTTTTKDSLPRTGPCEALPYKILERATADRPDESVGYKVHVMYVLPSDVQDEHLDTTGALVHSVNSFARWLCEQTGGSGLVLDTYQGGLDISFVRLPATDAVLMQGSELPWKVDPQANPFIRDDIERRIKTLGFSDPKKIYAVYYGGTSNTSCGGGPWPPHLVGSVAAVYLRGGYLSKPTVPRCETNKLAAVGAKPGYLDFSMIHEIFHTLGLAPACGPHHTLQGHVSDSTRDIMYQGEQSWDTSNLTIDVNRDDYYKAGISNCPDLSTSVFLSPGGLQAPPGW